MFSWWRLFLLFTAYNVISVVATTTRNDATMTCMTGTVTVDAKLIHNPLAAHSCTSSKAKCTKCLQFRNEQSYTITDNKPGERFNNPVGFSHKKMLKKLKRSGNPSESKTIYQYDKMLPHSPYQGEIHLLKNSRLTFQINDPTKSIAYLPLAWLRLKHMPYSTTNGTLPRATYKQKRMNITIQNDVTYQRNVTDKVTCGVNDVYSYVITVKRDYIKGDCKHNRDATNPQEIDQSLIITSITVSLLIITLTIITSIVIHFGWYRRQVNQIRLENVKLKGKK